MNNPKFEFKPGDRVRFGEMEGTIELLNSDAPYPLMLLFDEGADNVVLTLEGKFHKSHPKPCITLISRPKKKVKKTLEAWANVYEAGTVPYTYKKDADLNASENRIACVRLTGEYEIEE